MTEPAVGEVVHVGGAVGLGDHIVFVHVADGPRGWVEHVNSSLRGRRVSWPVVQFWL